MLDFPRSGHIYCVYMKLKSIYIHLATKMAVVIAITYIHVHMLEYL